MSIRNTPTLWCDGIEDDGGTGVRHAEGTRTASSNGMVHFEGSCPHWIQEGDTGREIRSNARRAGWKRIDGRDYSPPCARLLAGEVQSNG